MKFEERPYQVRGVADIYAAVRAGRRRMVYRGPPGCGKTAMIFRMLRDAMLRQREVWALAPRRNLVVQLRDRVAEYSDGAIMPTIVMDGHPFNAAAPARVASIQTVLSREVEIPQGAVVFVDECHLGHAFQLITARPDIIWIGFTGTPVHDNGQPLGDIFEVLIQGPQPSELIADGKLVDPEVYFHDTDGPLGDPPCAWFTNAFGLRTIAFAPSIKAGMAIADLYNAGGVRAALLRDTTSDDDRSAALQQLERRALDVVVNVGLYCEGTDLPWLECVADFARSSLSRYVQKISRVCRPSSEALRKVHLDHAGNVGIWLRATADRPWDLKTSARKMGLLSAPDFFKCPPPCGYMKPSVGPCPKCGAAPVTSGAGSGEVRWESQAGELQRLTTEREERLKRELAAKAEAKARRRVLKGIAARVHGIYGCATLASAWWTEFQRGSRPWPVFLSALEQRTSRR